MEERKWRKWRKGNRRTDAENIEGTIQTQNHDQSKSSRRSRKKANASNSKGTTTFPSPDKISRKLTSPSSCISYGHGGLEGGEPLRQRRNLPSLCLRGGAHVVARRALFKRGADVRNGRGQPRGLFGDGRQHVLHMLSAELQGRQHDGEPVDDSPAFFEKISACTVLNSTKIKFFPARQVSHYCKVL